MLPKYISANYFSQFIDDKAKIKLSTPIIYIDTDDNEGMGISATALVDICDIWYRADQKGALKNRENAKIEAKIAYTIF